MTVCIAGVCQQDEIYQVVLCSDMRIETAHSGGDVGIKMEFLAPGCIALLAGDTAHALRLLSVFRSHFKGGKPEDPLLYAESEIRVCANIHRKNLCDDYIQSRLSISYEEFLKDGKTMLPEDVYRQLLYEAQALDIGCELILVSVVRKFPRLYVLGRDGMVSERRSFAAIGSGATIAESALFQRRYMDVVDLLQGIYYIYEAKRLSHIAPGVGTYTHMATIEPIIESGQATGNAAFGEILIDGLKYLERSYQKLGLQKYKPIGRIPEKFFAAEDSKLAYGGPS